MTTLQTVELGVLGPLQVRQYGLPVSIPGAKPRALLTMLGLYGGSVVSADTLVELLWGADPPRTAAKALQTHVSSLRRTLGDGFVLTEGTGWTLSTTEIDASRYKLAVKKGREAVAAGDASRAAVEFDAALTLWRGTPELPDGPRGVSEKTRWIEGHAALVEDRADALLATGRAAEIIGELEAAIADAPLRERRWGQLMLALYRAGRQGEALGAYQRARALLAEELGVDPGPDLRRLESAIVAQDTALEMPVSQQLSAVTRAVTFLLTDIEGSTAAWEADADAMAVALARHDEIVEQVVTSRGGRLIKTRGEGDATFSVFERPSAAAAAAIELQEAIRHEPWALLAPMRIRVALHTGEVELRDGDYFGRAVNRAARLRSLAEGGQILCSGATAELVIDSLRDDVLLADLGMRHLKNLARPEHVFELRLQTDAESRAPTTDAPIERPALPAVLAGPGPFVGRGLELERLRAGWQTALAAGTGAVLIAGEPGVGKTRLAGEWCRQADDQGAVVLYGRCDEDLGAPYQPFAEALRSLVPCLGTKRLRGLRGVEALLPLVPALSDVLPDLAAAPRADPDTERYALFDAVVGLLGIASASAPVVLVLDDLHWASKPTLLLLRHLLRFGEQARVQIVGTYRSTDLDRAHPLAAMLADLHRDGSADRLSLGGLDENDVTAYVAEAGYDDEELARALASVTGGNPFFLIEALRHVDESGGRWDPGTLPQGVREAVSRRLSRLPVETNKALAAAAVVGSRFAVDLVERVVDQDLVDAFDEACKAGILIEEPGGRYRFNHAIVRQSLLTELASVRRMRLHQRIAVTLETEPGADEELLAELAYHYFECAWAGNAAKAVDYCRRAADQAMARLAYEGAADLYDKALHALEELDEELPDRDDQLAELLIARCEALLAAGDVASARGAVAQLQAAAADSARLAAWGTCFDGQLSMLTDPERLDEIESALAAAAAQLVGLEDAAGEAKAHTVRAGCLARLGRIGDAETALDQALTAARRAHEHRRVNSVLANAPLAALWGPNPVPRAGGRCLDVVRLLRITTGSPVVEATSTRCQGVLDAFRGRAAAGRQLIESARRSLTELGMRHALLEVDQFAGIVELVADDPVAAETYLRRAYEGFRRMGLDADTAETAALLARACLALDRDDDASELCTESEHLAGHALKASITWRTVRAQLLSRRGDHGDARRVAREAVAIAERTDALVDHGDASLALAAVLDAAGDAAGARAAAEQAVALYERKGAAALTEKARKLTGATNVPATPTPGEPPTAKLDNACARVIRAMHADFDSDAFAEAEKMYAPNVIVESRRKIVGFAQADVPSGDWPQVARHLRQGWAWIRYPVIAIRGERLALTRIELGANDMSPGAPHEKFLGLWGLDEEGRIALQVFFDIEDIDAAMAELEAVHSRFEEARALAPQIELDNECWRVAKQAMAAFNREALDEAEQFWAPDLRFESRRKIVGLAAADLPPDEWYARRVLQVGGVRVSQVVIAIRGERLALTRTAISTTDVSPGAPSDEFLRVFGIDREGRIALEVWFDIDDMDAAMAELDAAHARIAEPHPRVTRLENAASRVDDKCYALFAAGRTEEIGALYADDIKVDDRRHGLRRQTNDRATALDNVRAIAALGANVTNTPLALRGERLCLSHILFERREAQPDGFKVETLELTEVDVDGLMVARVVLDPDDLDAAYEELNARYLAGEAAPYADTWRTVMEGGEILNRHEPGAMGQRIAVFADHRRIPFAADDIGHATDRLWELVPDARYRIAAVHALDTHGAVVNLIIEGADAHGNELQWSATDVITFVTSEHVRLEVYEEYDIDAALARFEELRPRRLENAASRLCERAKACFAAGDWDGFAATLAADICSDDRRRVVNAGLQHGRDAVVAEISAIAEVGVMELTSEAIATRGERLVLSRGRISERDQRSGAFRADLIDIIEINAGGQAVGRVVFDPDDLDAALEELEARYLAGEAAAHARTWSVIADAFATVNRRELPAVTPDWVNIDHRRGTSFAPRDMVANIRAAWDQVPDFSLYIEAVHRLTNLGAVVTRAVNGTTKDGFDAEWRVVELLTTTDGLINRLEMFDEADLDAALARFDELTPPAPRLENKASRVDAQCNTCFAARDWRGFAELMAEDISVDDRRRIVGAGMRRGRDAEIANVQAIAETGCKDIVSTPIATRGDRLALTRNRFSGSDLRAEAFHSEAFVIVELDTEGRVAARVAFDIDNIDAAFEELEARYVAGEATAHSRAWSLIAEGHAAFNRRELPAKPPELLDHRPLVTIDAGDPSANVRDMWDFTPDLKIYIEAVHRLSDFGAVFTQVSHATAQTGFDAEWRVVELVTIEGDRIDRGELFEEADMDAALAKFDELARPARHLENAATSVYERLWTHFRGADWPAVADVFGTDILTDDRRRVVNAGIERGRDIHLANLRRLAEIGATVSSNLLATRGQRLILNRIRTSNSDLRLGEFDSEMLNVIEIDDKNRIARGVLFDVDDIDAALAELDARYLAGEASPHAHTWSLVARTFAGLNRREVPATTPDWVHIDHRQIAMYEVSDLATYLSATWDVTPQSTTYVEAVHRLTDIGAVLTNVAYGASQEGFEVEWREISLIMFEGERINRGEDFDEADLDVALARFEELSPTAPRLENEASRMYDRFNTFLVSHDWDAMGELVTDDVCNDDRRRLVSLGIQRGRDAQIAIFRAAVDVGIRSVESIAIATRGERLALTRTCVWGDGQRAEAFGLEMPTIVEIAPDNRISGGVTFDLEDIDAAFEELEARYLAGEAAPYAEAWSVISRAYAAFNRREMFPTTTDLVSLDHRRGAAAFAPGELTAYIRAAWKQIPNLTLRIEAVHRLTSLGAVYTQVLQGTSAEGFAAEWRIVGIMTVDGNLVNRAEIFDETDLDIALAHFEELSPTPPRLENAASHAVEQCAAYFTARDWDALAQMIAHDAFSDDRRRVVGAEAIHGRDADIANLRAIADLWITSVTSTAIATRGQRLVLTRACYAGLNQGGGAILTEVLGVVEIDADNRIVARVGFGSEDLDAAFEELEARYLAGEAASHAKTWSVISRAYAALNRHEIYPTTDNLVSIDHRRGAAAFAPGELIAYMRAAWEQIPNLTLRIETVHRLTNLGAVYTQVLKGASDDNFDAEWRIVEIMTVEGELVSRAEIFDETDLDAALELFDQLDASTPRLGNAATQTANRFVEQFTTRDWGALAETLADDYCSDDRRPVVGAGARHGRDGAIANGRVMADLGFAVAASRVIATRGGRLTLMSGRFSGRDQGPEAFSFDALGLIEINTNERITSIVVFEPDDIDAAFKELDARYLAGEAGAAAHTWSLVASVFAAFNRRELPATTQDWVNVDRRRGAAFASGDAVPYVRAAWDVAPDINIYIATAHRLHKAGAVVTYAAGGTSGEGFQAEWREIAVLTFEGELISRCEIFDEADIDTALARFDELTASASQLGNAATRARARAADAFNRRDMGGFRSLHDLDGHYDDRRKGLRDSGKAEPKVMRHLLDAPQAWQMEIEPIALRGTLLGLTRERWRDTSTADRPITVETLMLTELSSDGLICHTTIFDPGDVIGAFDELTARWIASGDVAYPDVIWAHLRVLQELNRHDWEAWGASLAGATHINHRQLGAGETVADFITSATTVASLIPNVWIEPTEILKCSASGAVGPVLAKGMSTEGVEAEIPMMLLGLFDGDRLAHFELFDADKRDVALARFDELDASPHRLENAAIRTWTQIVAAINRRDAGSFHALSSADGRLEDRRKGLHASHEGLERRKAAESMCRAPESWRMEVEPVAIRGDRLGLTRERWRDTAEPECPVTAESLTLTEVTDGELAHYAVVFDPDDINGAFAELTTRWIASGEVAHPEVIKTQLRVVQAVNNHDWDAYTALCGGASGINHRQLGIGDTFADFTASLQMGVSLAPNLWVEPSDILACSALGVVSSFAIRGTLTHGSEVEIPAVMLYLMDADRIKWIESFDGDQRDLAIARFQELNGSS